MVESIKLNELRMYIEYGDKVDVLVTKYCSKGEIYLLRKAHAGRKLGVNLGKDLVIVSPEDFDEDFMRKL